MQENEHELHNRQAELRIVQDVETHGFHMGYIPESHLPGYAFTIGLYKSYTHPELIIFGLKKESLFAILSHAAERVKEGLRIESGMDYTDEFIANYPARFLEVNKQFYPPYLGYAMWFYQMADNFPALQLVWTDSRSNFPWDKDYPKELRFVQPLLDRNTDFWFFEERNTGVYTTQATLDGLPIRWVYHNSNGDWQFHSEELPEIENARLLAMEELVKKDPSLNELFDLEPGYCAFRNSADEEWIISEDKNEE